MFYTYLRGLVMFLLWGANGNAHFHHLENIPSQEENYILVAPHRTWWDPVYMAFATRPKQFIFMAKKELFQNRVFGWWIRMCGAFPIDRANPGAGAIKYPVKMLKNSQRSLIMFPSGSRHSTDVKGGVALIAKMAKVRIMPASYTGPMTLKGLIRGERVDMNFGEPIDISDIKKMNDEGVAEVANRIQTAFDTLDQEVAAMQLKKGPNPWLLLPRLLVFVVAVLVALLTFAVSFVASFVWDPDKHRK
ncbi:lysophospholipid acyltransferase family protein [Streptococcus himalayensis]|uniref:1-acyl-sn-glycerol-3-phosphate acyltransferase n=1 Tax=Streptococcus himalayensis TaxID=1888195 RepID=A0A917A624_9STRE|nr:1-acyl-sn-glycerol-3-phosphate acyltransferase [Streptococcus himalayensis]GGE29736.1 1-acyl-sn-glycerol-3-phosphate acyltransferase [Streptococcus himalayensis]